MTTATDTFEATNAALEYLISRAEYVTGDPYDYGTAAYLVDTDQDIRDDMIAAIPGLTEDMLADMLGSFDLEALIVIGGDNWGSEPYVKATGCGAEAEFNAISNDYNRWLDDPWSFDN